MHGSEERDLLFGKLFAYLTIIHSKRLLKCKSEILFQIYDLLVILLNKKIWIREVISETIVLLLYQLHIDASTIPILFDKIKRVTPQIDFSDRSDGIYSAFAYEIVLYSGIQKYLLYFHSKFNTADKSIFLYYFG
jgi:hypothetical protein